MGKRKKILITGASGFIGGFLVNEAIKRGYNVWAGVRVGSNKKNLLGKGINFIYLPYENELELADCIKKHVELWGVWDYIIHNAGITKTRNKDEFYKVNSINTKHLLKVLSIYAIPKKFILMSSLSSYGPKDEIHYTPIKIDDEQTPNTMNEYTPKKGKNKFGFVKEYVDTLTDGTTILPISEKEKVNMVYYRKHPKSEKHIVKGIQSSGVDEVFSRDGVQQFLGEAFKEVDIFNNNIPLFLQRFVSPLSTIGPNYYKYYLMDTLKIDGQNCVDLGFVPFNSETFGFTGHLYVTLDSTYFVKRAILNVPKDINLNFISHMTIEQTFERTTDSIRLITKDDIKVNFKLSEKSKGLYARRLNIYRNHSFDVPNKETSKVFEEKAPILFSTNAYSQTNSYWESVRPSEAIRKNPNSVSNLMEKLRSVPIFYYTEKVISTIISGYIPTNKNPIKNKFEFGPMNSTFNGNAIEGGRFRVGGGTTPVFNKRWLFDGYVAYGTKDQKFKYDALVEYSFNDRKDYRLEFPIHSLRLEYMYDLNKLGQQYMYTSKDNMMLAIKRKKDTRATYLRKAEMTYTREHYNGVSYGAVLRNLREYSTPYAEFNQFESNGSIKKTDHYDLTALELRFRYGKNEKFYQTRTQRIPITYDALIFNINHVMAKKGFLGSTYNYQRTDIGVQKRFWFSAFGYIDFIAKAGKVWNKVPYPLLILPNANLTYTIQPEAYTNMNAIEFCPMTNMLHGI